jgi:hypothetical protein
MAHPVPTKLAVMTRVNAALLQTDLNTAQVWNPFTSITEGGDPSGFLGTPGTDPRVPQVIDDTTTFTSLSTIKKSTWQATARHNSLISKDAGPEAFDEPVFERLRLALKLSYLQRGAESVRKFPGGNCTMFTCAAIGFLAENLGLLAPGTRIELFRYTDGQSGHAFAVVDRVPGDANVTAGWGATCYVIDPWYARHRLQAPGTNPVKDMTAGTAFYDQAYVKFLNDAKSRISQVTFTYDELRDAFS